MTDKFLQRILDATAQMREQTDDRSKPLSEKARQIEAVFECCNFSDSQAGDLREMFMKALGESWYLEPKNPYWNPIKFSLIKLKSGRLGCVTSPKRKDLNYILQSHGTPNQIWAVDIDRPATVAEIHEWYQEFLK